MDFTSKATPKLRYKRPKMVTVPARRVTWTNAKKAAAELPKIEGGQRYYFIVSGGFIFAEFIEALVYKEKWHIKRMICSTLSMSMDNVYTFKNLITGGFVEQLDIVINNSFYVHERNNIIRALVEECDIDDKFQLAVAGTHMKVLQIETMEGLKITIHGSSNLRSSGNIEQGMIDTCTDIYDFNESIHDEIIAKHATINKAIRHKVLWDAVEEGAKKFSTLEF